MALEKFEPMQVYEMLNEVNEEVLGRKDLTVKDTTSLANLGEVLKSDIKAFAEPFFDAILAKVGDTWIKAQEFDLPSRKILRREHDFGLYLEKISFGIAQLKENKGFPGNVYPDGSDPYNAESTIPIHAKLFKALVTYGAKEPIPVSQMMMSFKDAYTMGAFINGLYTAIDNAMKLAETNTIELAVNTNMAVALNSGNGLQARNLLAEYNALVPTANLTVASALMSKDFLRWACREIKQTIGYMQSPTVAYNASAVDADEKNQFIRQTKKENVVVEMLGQFASAYETFLESDTFHNEMIALPMYSEVPFWQSTRIAQDGANAYDFSAVSSIAIHNDELSEDNDIEQSGIICFVHDLDSCAATAKYTSSYELYDPDQRRFIVFRDTTVGYAVDPTENAIVFYLAETSTDEDLNEE